MADGISTFSIGGLVYHQADKGRWECAVEEAEAALASTTEETEMEKLVAWLKEKRKHYAKMSRDYLDGGFETGFSYGEREEAIKQVLSYITTQFGEEEGDASG